MAEALRGPLAASGDGGVLLLALAVWGHLSSGGEQAFQ